MSPPKTRSSAPDRQQASNLRHLLTAGALVAGTLGTLLLGAALQVDPQSVALEPAAVITERTPPARGLPTPEPVPVQREPTNPRTAAANEPRTTAAPPLVRAPVQAPPASLTDRADDAQRLLQGDDAWTLKFSTICNHDSASGLLSALDNDPRLYLIPITLNDQPCFRVCWDTFSSRDRALASREIPAALRKVNPEPIPRKVVDLIP